MNQEQHHPHHHHDPAEELLERFRATLNRIKEIKEVFMTDLDQAIADLQSEVASVATAIQAEVATLQAEIATLQQENDADTAAASAAAANIETQVAALAALVPAPATPPSGPTGPTGPTGTLDPASGKTLYQFTATDGSTPDLTAWTVASDVVGPGSQTLYTFNADVAGQAPTGASTAWSIFTGSVTQVGGGGNTSDLAVPEQELDATNGQPFVGTITASGGTAPYTFSVDQTTLPAGLASDAEGNVTGTASVSGDTAVTVGVTDAAGDTASGTVDFVVS